MNFEEYATRVRSGEIPIEAHGHVSYSLDRTQLYDDLMFIRLTDVVYDGQLAPETKFPLVKEGNILGQCAICGLEPSITFYEDRIEVEDNHFDVGPFSVDIAFPSGRILFNDTFPEEAFEVQDFDVNTTIGTKLCSEHYARQGMMHFYVGNSCPTVWKQGDTLFIGKLTEGSETKSVAGISTDLWWATALDQTILTRRLMNRGNFEEVDTLAAIDHMRKKGGSARIKPGTYRCTSYYHVGDLDYGINKEQVFCKLELLSRQRNTEGAEPETRS